MKLQIQIILHTTNMNNIVNMNDIKKSDNIFKKKSYMKLKNIEIILYANVIILAFDIENYVQINTTSFIKKIISQFMRKILL